MVSVRLVGVLEEMLELMRDDVLVELVGVVARRAEHVDARVDALRADRVVEGAVPISPLLKMPSTGRLLGFSRRSRSAAARRCQPA